MIIENGIVNTAMLAHEIEECGIKLGYMTGATAKNERSTYNFNYSMPDVTSFERGSVDINHELNEVRLTLVDLVKPCHDCGSMAWVCWKDGKWHIFCPVHENCFTGYQGMDYATGDTLVEAVRAWEVANV